MRLALPLGLLGLIAIAALILIYILKPKYQEKKVSSTYIWKLSMRYQKKRMPFQWLQNWLLLLLQILILAIIALMMTEPYVVLASKSGEKIVILDASASMTATTGRSTRFDRAKEEISSLAELTVPGDKFSVILAGGEADFVVRRSDSQALIRQKLAEARCTLSQPDFEGAMELAENVLSENPTAEVYLYTDTVYEDSGNVNVIDMSSVKDEWNLAVENFTAKIVDGKYVFTAQIGYYGAENLKNAAVTLRIDDKKPYAPELAVCENGKAVNIVWDSLNITSFTSAEVTVDAEDSFANDNSFVLFNPKGERFKIQYVSDSPYDILLAGLSAWGKATVDVVGADAEPKTEGYDLYVYEHIVPAKRPSDGAVWLVAPEADSLTESWDIKVGASVGTGTKETHLTFSGVDSSSEANSAVMKGVTASAFYVTKYSRITQYPGYETLMSSSGDPLLLVKNENGLKTAVFAYDFRFSNPICYDFPILISNLCNYCARPMLSGSLFEVGDTFEINARPDAQTVTLTDQDEDVRTYTSFPIQIKAAETGVFRLEQTLSTGRIIEGAYFVHVNAEEGKFYQKAATLSGPVVLPGTVVDQDLGQDRHEIVIYLAAAMLVLLCVEWGVQYREQY